MDPSLQLPIFVENQMEKKMGHDVGTAIYRVM